MLKWLLGAFVNRFETRYGYDVSYMRELLATDTAAFMAFSKIQGFSSYRKAPPEALVAVGIAGTLAEDCGPCTQIVISMAEEGGLSPAVLKAIVSGDEAGMGPDAALAWRFARASLARDMETADPLRDEIVRRWGRKALASLSLALAAARVYPTVKYALGYGKACSRVQVAGEAVTPLAA
jgi:hypothetical protein